MRHNKRLQNQIELPARAHDPKRCRLPLLLLLLHAGQRTQRDSLPHTSYDASRCHIRCGGGVFQWFRRTERGPGREQPDSRGQSAFFPDTTNARARFTPICVVVMIMVHVCCLWLYSGTCVDSLACTLQSGCFRSALSRTPFENMSRHAHRDHAQPSLVSSVRLQRRAEGSKQYMKQVAYNGLYSGTAVLDSHALAPLVCYRHNFYKCRL